MKEIAEFLKKNTVQIVNTKFKEQILKDFECCIRDDIQQQQYEVLLTTIMDKMRDRCRNCAQLLFDRLERLTKYLDYSTDRTNGSIFEESSKVTTILAFATDDTRKFVCDAFVEVLVNWAYESILKKPQVQEELYKEFNKVVNVEIHQHASTVSVDTSMDLFDSIAKYVVTKLSTIMREQFDLYSSDYSVQQGLEQSVNAMADKIMKYNAPTPTTPTPSTILPPPIPSSVASSSTPSAILPPPIPSSVASSSTPSTILPPPIPSSVASSYTPSTILPQPLPSSTVGASSPRSLASLLPQPLPSGQATLIQGQSHVHLPLPPLRSFGTPQPPKAGQFNSTTSSTPSASTLPPPPPFHSPSRSSQPPKTSRPISVPE